MDEHGLIFSLDEVEGQESTKELLSVGRRKDRVEVCIVQVRAQREEKQRWNQRWTKIFGDVYGAP